MDAASSQNRWRALWERLGGDGDKAADFLQPLLSAYAENGRHYHTAAHLKDVLERLDWARDALSASGELSALSDREKEKMFDIIELSLWYHDAVYDAKAKDNEAKSRDWLLADAQKAGLPEETAKAAAQLVDLTAHHKDAKTLAERIMTDCDLAILGADEKSFAAYDANIRKEYAHVPAPAYRTGRARVLKGFLEQPQIFKTGAFRDAFEQRAKSNLAAATRPIWRRALGFFHK